MRYVTDFSSESFGMYVGIIYMSMVNVFAPLILVITLKQLRELKSLLMSSMNTGVQLVILAV